MDVETLRQTAPLVQGRLNDQRDEIYTGYAEWAIFTQDCPEQFTTEDIVEIISSRAGIEFEEIQIDSAIDNLNERGVIEHESGDEYVKSAERDFNKIESLIDDCWNDFQGILSGYPRDIDIHHIDDNIEPAFRNFLKRYAEELEKETEILEETHQDVIHTDNILGLIGDIIEEEKVDKEDAFRECLQELLRDPTESLKEYVGVVYVAIVNSDLLRRQKSIELPEMADDEKRIFFDSNVIQGLLCENGDGHPLIKKIVERSAELGFDLYYFSSTVSDLQRSIDGAGREMSGLRDGNYSTQTFKNQFIEDWHAEFRRNGTEWGDYFDRVQKWQLVIEEEYNISEYNKEIENSEEEISRAKDIIDKIDSKRNKNPKKPDILNHDAEILGKTASLREKVGENHNIGPLLLSLDNSVTQASDYAHQEDGWQEGIAVPPRVWFNYLLTFTSAEIEQIEVGEAILNISANIQSTPTVEEYSKAVEEKADLAPGSAEYLSKYLKSTAYSSEIKKSLEKDDGQVDEWAFKALTDEEAIDEFTEHKKQKEQIRNLGKKVQELQQEKKRLREDRETVSETEESSSNKDVTDVDDLRQDLEGFIDLYYENVPPEIREEISPPPSTDANLEAFREWLNLVTTAISVSERTSPSLTAVQDYGERLLSDVK